MSQHNNKFIIQVKPFLKKGEILVSSKFAKKWEERDGSRLKAVFKSTAPLKSKVQIAIRRIEAQIEYMQNTINNMVERDKYLFSQIVEAYAYNQPQRAKIFANELAELRRIANFMMSAQLALERVVLRFKTVAQMGNIVSVIAPATKIVQSVRSGLSGILPHAEKELGEIGTMLNDIMIEAGETTGFAPDFAVASEDAKAILSEAALVAEQKMKEKFPELPSLKQPEEARQDSGFP
jgi:division protein CdvB (Snf7/Vps24/ESCRT-III family)